MDLENVRPSWFRIWAFRGVPGFPQDITKNEIQKGQKRKENKQIKVAERLWDVPRKATGQTLACVGLDWSVSYPNSISSILAASTRRCFHRSLNF